MIWDVQIAAAWIIYLIIGLGGNSSNKQPSTDNTAVVSEQTKEAETAEITEDKKQGVTEKNSPDKTQTEEPAEEPVEEPEETEADVTEEEKAEESAKEEESVSTEYKNALKKGKQYSSIMHLSKQGIYDQLTSEYGEKFTEDEAEYAVDNVDADWNENALAKAKEYQDLMSMSNSAIYDQLTSEYGEKFTDEEAQYAVDHLEWFNDCVCKITQAVIDYAVLENTESRRKWSWSAGFALWQDYDKRQWTRLYGNISEIIADRPGPCRQAVYQRCQNSVESESLQKAINK